MIEYREDQLFSLVKTFLDLLHNHEARTVVDEYSSLLKNIKSTHDNSNGYYNALFGHGWAGIAVSKHSPRLLQNSNAGRTYEVPTLRALCKGT